MELNILDWFQTLHTPILDKIMTSIKKLGDAGIFWIILTLLFLIIPKMRKTGIILATALIMDLLICNVAVKNLVARTRPYDVNTSIQLLVAKLHDYSFPSGHTCASFAAAMVYLKMLPKKYGVPFVILAVLIAFSRLYVGVHYLTDVIGGLIIGIFSAWTAVHLMEYLRKRMKKSFDADSR